MKPTTNYIVNMNNYMKNHWQYNNNLHQQRHQNRIKFVGSFCIGKTLEVGMANGFSTNLLQQTFPECKFTGLEPTDWGFQEAEKLYPHIPKVKAFAEEIPFESHTFDTVLAAEIMEHVEEPRKVLNEFFRVAKKRIIVTSPVSEAGMKNDPDHKRFFTYRDMYDLVKYYSNFSTMEPAGLNRNGEVVHALADNLYPTFAPEVFFGIFIIKLKGK
jgi:ubiquinone/menaquinone biosynthesis C-methylase UbiE